MTLSLATLIERKKSSISMNCVASGTNGAIGHYRQEVANIRVLEVE